MQTDGLTQDGFPGQRLRVLPAPLVTDALGRDVTSRLLVTDAGYFPRAANHGRARRRGTAATVVIVCTGGRGWCEVAGRTTEVLAGHALVIPPHVPHVYWADRLRPWTIWWLHVVGGDVPSMLSAIGSTDAETVVSVRDVQRAAALAEQAVECLESDETRANLLQAAGVGWALLAQLAADSVAGAAGWGEPVRDAQEYLRAHLDTHVSVAVLARNAGLSTSHFSSLFRSATGGGVVEYLKRLRMARARELLITTSWSIGEVAQAVGYNDAFYFSRQFSAVNGSSPSAFRAQSEREDSPGYRGAAPQRS